MQRTNVSGGMIARTFRIDGNQMQLDKETAIVVGEPDATMQPTPHNAAKYKADRALFLLLLSAPCRSIRLSTPRSPEYGHGLEPPKRVAPAHKK
jgi:hypothetical protein